MSGDIVFNNAEVDIHVSAINIYGNPAEVSQRLGQIAASINSLLSQGVNVMADLDQVLQDVQDESTQIDGLSTLTAGLKQQLADALAGVTLPPAVQAKVDAVFNGVEANKQKVVDAINANTPAAAPTP